MRTGFLGPLILRLQMKESWKMAKTNGKMIANNKKAYHDYFILENYEAGVCLLYTSRCV